MYVEAIAYVRLGPTQTTAVLKKCHFKAARAPLEAQYTHFRSFPGNEMISNHFVSFVPHENHEVVEIDSLKPHAILRGMWEERDGFALGLLHALKRKYSADAAPALGSLIALIPC